MGFFDFFRKTKDVSSVENMRLASTLDNTYPIFTSFGEEVYASDVVQQAMYCIIKEMKKLNPKHVRFDVNSYDYMPIHSDLQGVLDEPNELMTRSDFLEKVTYTLLTRYNAFVYVERDENFKVISLHPLMPTGEAFLESEGKLYVALSFTNGETLVVPYDKLIHIKSHYSVNSYMGGGFDGRPDNEALLNTLNLNHVMLEGVEKSLESSYAINGIVKYNTMLDDGKIEADIKRFERQLANSESGLLGIDMKSDVVQFKRDLKTVDGDTLKFLDDKILRHFGVPLAILQGDYTKEQYESFYQSTLEPLVISYSEAFTKAIFTRREKSFGNKVYFYTKELSFMSISQVIEVLNGTLGQGGHLMVNEARMALGWPPLPEFVGKRLQSLNYTDVGTDDTAEDGDNIDSENIGEVNASEGFKQIEA